jgi:thiopeptide-type bacteriocin biosynthesis protein
MQSAAVSLKKALLLLLSQREAERLGVSVHADEIGALIEGFRKKNLLLSDESFNEWLSAVQFDVQRFHAFMRKCAVVEKLERTLSDETSALADDLMSIEQGRPSVTADFFSMPRVLANTGWLQLNVSINRQAGEANPAAMALFDGLRQQLPKWRGEGLVTRFFFVRKPPGARLRFLCPKGESQVTGELELMLQQLQRQGFVEHFFRSCYEPEQARFGGAEAMSLVHDYFDADTSQWLLLQQISAAKRRSFPAGTLVTNVLNHLFTAVVGDPAEVWDIWCQCSELAGRESFEADEDYLDPMFASIEALRPLASPDEMAILDAYESANMTLATGLKQLWSDGKLQRGVRGVLATVAMFGLNRHGIDQNVQSKLVHLIRRGFAARSVVAGSR